MLHYISPKKEGEARNDAKITSILVRVLQSKPHRRFGQHYGCLLQETIQNCTRHAQFIAMHRVIQCTISKFYSSQRTGATESESVFDCVAESEAAVDSVCGSIFWGVQILCDSASEYGPRLGPRLLDDVIARCIQAQQSGICYPASLFSLLLDGIARMWRASFMSSSFRHEAESRI